MQFSYLSVLEMQNQLEFPIILANEGIIVVWIGDGSRQDYSTTKLWLGIVTVCVSKKNYGWVFWWDRNVSVLCLRHGWRQRHLVEFVRTQ